MMIVCLPGQANGRIFKSALVKVSLGVLGHSLKTFNFLSEAKQS